jgi:hypothetical protein
VYRTIYIALNKSSKYNSYYHCTIHGVKLSTDENRTLVEVLFHIVGNNSLGALQDPEYSRLLRKYRPKTVTYDIRNSVTEHKGVMFYEIPILQLSNQKPEISIDFEYGYAGYSKVSLLSIDHSSYESMHLEGIVRKASKNESAKAPKKNLAKYVAKLYSKLR